MSVRSHPNAFYVVHFSHLSDKWEWSIITPTSSVPLSTGCGKDKEHATQCAVTALRAIQNGYTVGQTCCT